jgi:hypothetical protein
LNTDPTRIRIHNPAILKEVPIELFTKKLSLSYQKYWFGIPDPGVKKAPDPQHCLESSSSRALEMFAETLLVRANEVTTKRGARTLTPSHLKFCIESEARFYSILGFIE